LHIISFLSVNKFKFLNICILNGPLIDVSSQYFLQQFNDYMGIKKYLKTTYFEFPNFMFINSICIFFNVNIRYISPILNIKLRTNSLRKNINYYYIGTFTNYNFYVKHLGLTERVLTFILSGKH
jgi:hypothetical protein